MAAIDSVKALLARGMKQSDIARAIRVQPKVISAISTGQRPGRIHEGKLAALLKKTPQHIPIEGVPNGPNGNGGGDRGATGGVGSPASPLASEPHGSRYDRIFPDDLQSRLATIRAGYADGTLTSAIGLAENPEPADRPISQNAAYGPRQYGENQLRNAGNNALDASYDRGNRQTASDIGGSDGAHGNGGRGASAGERESVGDYRGVGGSAPRKGLSPLPWPKGQSGNKPPKNDQAGPKSAYDYIPWLQGQHPLSPEEAQNIREDVIFGLEQLERGLDELISNTNKEHVEAAIWSTIDREDNEFLADALLNAALKDPAVAWAVKGIVHASAMLRAGLITLPRFVETVRFYREHGGLALPL